MDRAIPILLYHSVSDKTSADFQYWTVSLTLFESHLAYLTDQGYQVLTVSQLVDAICDLDMPLPSRVAVITFDDGFADFYWNALPILTRHNLPATLYITTAFVGQTSRWLRQGNHHPMMTWQQIRETAAQGIEIGAHSRHHYQLDVISRDVAYQEISCSKKDLEQQTGNRVLTFAYPHGYFDQHIKKMTQMAGYASACAVKHGLSSRKDDPYALARIIISNKTSVEDFANLLAGKGLTLIPKRERIQTTGWRLVRRFLARYGTLNSFNMSKG